MDGISSLAIAAFETTQRFHRPGLGYAFDAVEVRVLPEDAKVETGETVNSPGASVIKHQFPEPRLLSWFESPPYSTTELLPEAIPEASLKAVRIDRNLDVSLNISQECFARLFDTMRADPAVKYVICHDYDGFHEFSAPGYLTTRFIGSPIYAILWTFDPIRVVTRALFIRRRQETFTNFVNTFRAFKAHIYSPWLPAFVSSFLLLQWSDRETSDFELQVVRNIEGRTGFGPQSSGLRGLQASGMEGKFNIDILTSWSQAVNEVSGNISNKIRHQKISKTVLDRITEASQLGDSEGVPEALRERHRQSLNKLSQAVPLLERQMITYMDYLAYLKDRAERLSAVLFALLTHEDADASINIATATKQDSSSMKTVAVMTMAFLPATFFAALFAVPSLRWDQAVVVQDKFWVYWAFTLPFTALVFLVWYIITQQNWVLGHVRKATQKQG